MRGLRELPLRITCTAAVLSTENKILVFERAQMKVVMVHAAIKSSKKLMDCLASKLLHMVAISSAPPATITSAPPPVRHAFDPNWIVGEGTDVNLSGQ
jgi:hypothetical protein